MVIKVKYFLLFILLITECFPQQSDIQKKESELTSIKSEIKNLEQELNKKSKAEKSSFEAVENLNKQNFLLNKILADLRSEIQKKENEISKTQTNIALTEKEIKALQENYAKYVVAVYKKGRYNELESLFDSESLQQALMRNYYLKAFSHQREKDLIKLQNKKNELAENKALLEKERNAKLLLVKAKDDERSALTQKLKEKKSILNSIRKNKKELNKALTAKKQSQVKMENLIARLIEEEERRKKEQLASIETSSNKSNEIKEENTGFEYDLSTSSFSTFAGLKGKMIWPLHKGKIIRKYGENKNQILKTVTLNYGIDIKAANDKNVRCVGEGVIAAIDWLPGYGNVVIVSHKDGYRTVYSHLSEIFISEGDKVKSGTVLAVVDEGLDGYVLHFEIWQGREKQNPELWLGK
jgi:septal ring factor EnvC (AmiA/AmiB activator)